jgi:hypothetical protein
MSVLWQLPATSSMPWSKGELMDYCNYNLMYQSPSIFVSLWSTLNTIATLIPFALQSSYSSLFFDHNNHAFNSGFCYYSALCWEICLLYLWSLILISGLSEMSNTSLFLLASFLNITYYNLKCYLFDLIQNFPL